MANTSRTTMAGSSTPTTGSGAESGRVPRHPRDGFHRRAVTILHPHTRLSYALKPGPVTDPRQYAWNPAARLRVRSLYARRKAIQFRSSRASIASRAETVVEASFPVKGNKVFCPVPPWNRASFHIIGGGSIQKDFFEERGETVSHKQEMAERGGFEPPEGCPSSVFKTDALNRSTISPQKHVPVQVPGIRPCEGKIKYSKKRKNQGICGKNGKISREDT